MEYSFSRGECLVFPEEGKPEIAIVGAGLAPTLRIFSCKKNEQFLARGMPCLNGFIHSAFFSII
jgi:hypothetical protein